MRAKKFQKLISVLISLSLTASIVCGNLITLSAADSPPMTGVEKRKDNQPKFNGYRIWDIRDWSPEEDPGSEFLRADVPLQERIEPFKPTQANPDLDSDAEIMLMQGDYGDAFVDGMMYNNTFGYHTLNYWQYVDYFSPWHGAAGAYTPEDLHDWDFEATDARGWEKRYFEFGILNIPNPAYTNAAHRNGVKSIACIYFDQYYRPGQTINELFVQDEDGTFPVAEKLIEMAEYFGYDGYFFNAEETVWPENEPKKKQFLARLTEAGLYTQYYNTNSYMNESKAEWLEYDIDGDGQKEKLQDSVFVNYSSFNTSSLETQMQFIQDNGYDPFKQVFYGVEANQGKFASNGHGSATNVSNLYAPGTKNLRASLALFTPSDFYQRSLPDDGFGDDKGGGRMLHDPDYQWMISERERMYFSGVLQDPTNTGKQVGFSYPEVNVANGAGWVGVADFASERSIIGGSTFYSSFNTGKGRQYFTNGTVTNEEDWSNINVQGVLPTWQWWFETPENTTLTYNIINLEEDETTDDETVETVVPEDTETATPPANTANVLPQAAAETATTATITINPTANGTITVNADDLGAVPIGSKVTITAQPSNGYVLAPRSLKVNGQVNTVMSFIMPAEDVTITAQFKRPSYEPLKADFDYGEKYYTGATEFERVGGYNGGSSLVLAGSLDARNTLRLFKTDLAVSENSTMDITYFKPTVSDGTELGLGLIFKDDPEAMEVIMIPGTGTKTSKWTTKTIDLSGYADREIATVALVVNPKQGAVANYQVNIGEIKLNDGQDHAPSQPTGFEIDRMFTNDELIVTWDLGSFDEVDNYEIYAQLSNGETLYCGGIFGDIFYIKTLLEEQDVATLELYAVGKDGSKSEPAVIDFNFNDKVSNVVVAEETKEIITRDDAVVKGSMKQTEELSVVSATWENPTEDYKALELTVTLDDSKDTATKVVKTVAKGETSADIIIPRAHGEKYNLAIRTVYNDGTKSEAINVTGNLKDVYVEPYNPELVKIDGKQATFFCPEAKDWLRMYVTVNGKPVTFTYAFANGAPTPTVAIRAATRMVGKLPSDSGIMKVVLEDYAGNFSEPTYIPYYADPDLEITADLIPDANLLAAVRSQAGTTIKAVTEFDGTLNLANKTIADFTGIDMLANVKTIDLTNTGLTVLGKEAFATNAEKLILKNNANLTKIDIEALSFMPELKELDITGCSNLRIMNINDTSLEKLTYGNASDFSKLISVDMSNAKFDMSEGTPERIFADMVKAQTTNAEDITETSNTKVNLAYQKTADPNTTTVDIAKANKLFDGAISYVSFPKTYPSYVGLTFDSPQEIVEWKFYNDTYANYGLADFGIQYSTDGSNWQTLGTPVTGCTSRSETQTIANPVAAKYYRLMYTVAQRSGPDVCEWELYGYEKLTYPAGVKFDGQRPVVTTDYPTELKVAKDQGNVKVADILTAATVRGTNARDLVGQDFIAEDYDVLSGVISKDVLVTITDSKGNVAKDVINTNTNGTYTVKLVSFNTENAEGEMLAEIQAVVGTGGVTPPTPDPTKPSRPSTPSGGGSTGVEITADDTKTEITVTEPDVYVSGTKVEVEVPDIDVSGATSSRPVEVKIDVPSEQILNVIRDTAGSTVTVDVVLPTSFINTANVTVKAINVDKTVFEQAKASGKEIVINVKAENGTVIAVWIFDEKTITNVKDTNLSVQVLASTALTNTASYGSNAAVVRFNHNGTLPGAAKVKVDASKYFNAGDKVILYYNNTATGKLEKVAEVTVGGNGYANIEISHCSDYVLVKSDVTTNQTNVANPQTGDANPLLAVSLLMAVISMGGLLVGKKLMSKEQ